jgi:hypothetical protein
VKAAKGKKSRFGLVALLAFGLWAVLLVFVQPLRLQAAAHLMRSAGTRSGTLQLADARVAVLLVPYDDDYRVRLADMYLSRGNSQMALAVLPSGSSATLRLKRGQILYANHKFQDTADALTDLEGAEPSILRSMALLELGKPSEAAQSALGAHTAAGGHQLALCYGVLGDQAALAKLQPDMTSSDYIAMKAGGLSLANLLIRSNMPTAARTVLLSTPDDSTTKFSLLAQLALNEPRSKDSLVQAAQYLKRGINLDPSNLALHQQLLAVAKEQNYLETINTETSRIHALETGSL